MTEPVSVQPMSRADLDEVAAIERLSHPIPKGLASFASDLDNPVARCFSLRVGEALVGYLVVWSSDVVEVIASGGGGFGDPHQRPAEVVARDVREGVVSPDAARDVYRVVVDPDTFELDEAATARLRA